MPAAARVGGGAVAACVCWGEGARSWGVACAGRPWVGHSLAMHVYGNPLSVNTLAQRQGTTKSV